MRARGGVVVALGLIGMLALAGCGGEPCECRVGDAAAPVAAADVAPGRTAAAPAGGALVGESPRAQLALETLDQLFAKSFAPIRALMTPELRLELTDAKLRGIVTGLAQAHGPVVRVIDAWTTTIKEKEESMPAAEVLLRMADDTRLGLMLVFDPQGAVKGLWLRPI